MSQYGADAIKTAQEASIKVTDIMLKKFGPPEDAKLIEFQGCEVVPDTEFRLSQIRRMDPWRIGYLSLKQDGTEHFSPETQL